MVAGCGPRCPDAALNRAENFKANHARAVRVEYGMRISPMEPADNPPASPQGDPSGTWENWQVERLKELAQNGSLAAGRELMHRAIAQSERASSHRPDLIEPALCGWLKEVLGAAFENPRQSIGALIAPPHRGRRGFSHAELVYTLTLSQEIYFRVRKATDAGMPLKDVFPAVAEELNALGYRNANNAPLQGWSVRRRFYEVSRRTQDGSG